MDGRCPGRAKGPGMRRSSSGESSANTHVKKRDAVDLGSHSCRPVSWLRRVPLWAGVRSVVGPPCQGGCHARQCSGIRGSVKMVFDRRRSGGTALASSTSNRSHLISSALRQDDQSLPGHETGRLGGCATPVMETRARVSAGNRDGACACVYPLGFKMRPRKRILPEWTSRIRKMKGWSARKTGTVSGPTDRSVIVTPVAAAASVPSSLTST